MAEDLPDWSHEVVVVKELLVTIEMSDTEGLPPLRVKFHPFIIGGTAPFTYDWDFGDGSPHSSEEAPVHTYDEVGDYIITLTLTDATGLQTKCARLLRVRQWKALVIYGFAFLEVLNKDERVALEQNALKEQLVRAEAVALAQTAFKENISMSESIRFENS